MLVGRSFESDYHASEDTLVARSCQFRDFHSSKSAHLEECTARCVHARSLEVLKGNYSRIIADDHLSADSTFITDTLKGNFVQAESCHLNIIEAQYAASITNTTFKTACVLDGPFTFLSKNRVYAHDVKAKDRIIVNNLAAVNIETNSSLQMINSRATHVVAYNVFNAINSTIETATLHVTKDEPLVELYNTELKELILIGTAPFKPLLYGNKSFRYKIELRNPDPAIHSDPPKIE